MAVKNFLRDIARYYMDFLETDFHKRSIPKRSIKYRDSNNALVGINLYRYESFCKKIWEVVNKPLSIENEFSIRKGQYKSRIKPNLKNYIDQQIDSFHEELFEKINKKAVEFSISNRGAYLEDPDGFKNTVIDNLSSLLQSLLIEVIVSKLEHVFSSTPAAVDSLYRTETELNDLILEDLNHAIDQSINSFLINGNSEDLLLVLKDHINEIIIKEKLRNYFLNFYVDDLYLELNELEANLKLFDNLELYIYLCDIKFNNNVYPIFYIPLELEKQKNLYLLRFDPHLFINKKTIEFIVQESKADLNKVSTTNLVDDRILYLNNDDILATRMQPLIDNVINHFKIDKELKVSESCQNSVKSILVSLSNNLNICLFDKSDESLVNDYEEILELLESDDNNLVETFKKIISEFIDKEPKVLNSEIENEWEKKSTSDKLIYDTPIPLNEEQRKILQSINNPDCKFITVQGPPGTGKSHTITAVVFDQILKDKSTLVLSDKKEALDVVENKIVETLNKVRINTEFQNPILRLGKAGNTYNKILNNTSIDRIKQHFLATKSDKNRFKEELTKLDTDIRQNIKSTVESYSSIDIKDIEKHTNFETKIVESDGLILNLNTDQKKEFLKILKVLFIHTKKRRDSDYKKAHNLYNVLKSEFVIDELKAFTEILKKFLDNISSTNPLKVVNSISIEIEEQISSYLYEFNEMKNGFLGLLFKKKKLERLNLKYNEISDFSKIIDIKNDHQQLSALAELIFICSEEYKNAGYSSDNEKVNKFLRFIFVTYHANIEQLAKYFNYEKFLLSTEDLFKETFTGLFNTKYSTELSDNKILLSKMKLVIDYLSSDIELTDKFNKIPQFDYSGDMYEKASLHTIQMASMIDERVISFYENNKATAKVLKEIIQKKQRFPRNKFKFIKKAFPCIIAGIRDYAEYIPLEEEAFDLIIIDEASQVSIAQAFPALLRAKKILVLGDNKQFSNVKTAHASSAINIKYLSSLRESFINSISSDPEKLIRLTKFNIKTSILEFFEFISNFDIMLKKHFRGYKELISFSSKYFYSDSLQSIKIRGRRADDTIKFSLIETDNKVGIGKMTNTNDYECQFICDRLVEHVENDDGLTIGIITPFTNQQQYISATLRKHPMYDDFLKKLQLKIMTFDSCQGEERDINYYSLVAIEEDDRLGYVFPSSININDDVEQKLRLQRLNVGFSRSKECIHFVLSKKIEDYCGSIGTVLMHYFKELENAKRLPEKEDLDSNSPMELKVLNWIKNSNFYINNSDKIEIKAQFPIGEYLKQINPFYKHPNYRCDFLFSYTNEKAEIKNLIIEYDGFKEHFYDLDNVNKFNYQYYYKEEDIEREKIIENYGYKFLRLNKFNLGDNPEKTISDKLDYLLKKKISRRAN